MEIDIRKVLESLKQRGFEDTWAEYSKKIPQKGKVVLPKKRGKEHILSKVISKIRKSFLELGFEEVINPVFVNESEVYKQYGPEAPIILDRIYYLAGLPRPDIGLEKEIKERIRKEVREIKINTLQSILRDYRKGYVKAEDLMGTLKNKLRINENEVIRLIKILREFFILKPIPSSLTLRSHMTATWFLTLKEMLDYRDPPLYLFSIDRVFRREQKEDESHLKTYHSASVVIVNKNLSEEFAENVTGTILKTIQKNLKVKFVGLRFQKKPETAKYYAKDKEWEVYVNFKGKKYEIGTFGFYSPVALARYEIPFNVYNFGIGVERIAQILTGEEDVRKLIYSYRYLTFSDKEIAKLILPLKEPKTKWGKTLTRRLVKKIEKCKDKIGPFKELAYQGKNLKIYLVEPDKEKKFAGPAAFNRLYVHRGNILSSQKESEGIYLGRYVDFILKKICAEIEEGKEGLFKIRWVERPSEINLYLPPKLLKWMERNGKKIEIGGPVFLDIYVEKNL